jgi:hypothetical protein
MFHRCPQCNHRPLPEDQALPAACPACGVILAKMAELRARSPARADADASSRTIPVLPLDVPASQSIRWFRMSRSPDRTELWIRAAVLASFAIWGVRLIAMNYRDGGTVASFIHLPLLVFHEAGHMIFMLFGEWVHVLGGTLGQLLMPALICGALLVKNRDPFGAALGLWLVGVSLLDISPYMYDALHPQLMLLSGKTGEDGGHDWIYLFSSLHLIPRSQGIGAFFHGLGAAVVVLALAWAGVVLNAERRELAG